MLYRSVLNLAVKHSLLVRPLATMSGLQGKFGLPNRYKGSSKSVW